MSAFQRLINPTNLLVVAVMIGVYLFRHSLFPELSESGEVKQLLGKIDSVIDRLDTLEAPPKREIAEMPPVQPAPVEVPVTSQAEVKTPASPRASEEIPALPKPQEQPATIEDKVGKSAGDSPSASALWQTARRAAWEGKSNAAVENYRALIAMQPDNYDAYGEMGNVLMQRGDNQGAVEAYSQAALLLGRSGYPQAAWQVLNIVSRLDQQKAKQLYESLYGQPLPTARQ